MGRFIIAYIVTKLDAVYFDGKVTTYHAMKTFVSKMSVVWYWQSNRSCPERRMILLVYCIATKEFLYFYAG
jgi:hypothetical protein